MYIKNSSQPKKAIKSSASKKPAAARKPASVAEVQRRFIGFARRYKSVMSEAVSDDYLLKDRVLDWTKYPVSGCVVDAVDTLLPKLSSAVAERDMVAIREIVVQLDGTSPTSPPYTPVESAWADDDE
jgi:hypothetical protein